MSLGALGAIAMLLALIVWGIRQERIPVGWECVVLNVAVDVLAACGLVAFVWWLLTEAAP